MICNLPRTFAKRKLLVSHLALATISIATTVHAQASNGTPATKPIQATLAVAATYDGNVARGTDALASARGLSNSEITYTPTAGVIVALPLGRELFSLNGSVGYDFHEKNKNLQSERIGISTGLDGKLGGCALGVGAGYSQHQSDLVDVTLAVSKNIQKSTTESIHESCATPIGVGESLAFSSSQTRNSATSPLPQQSLLDSNAYSVTGALGGRLPALGTVSLTSSLGKIEYVNTSTSLQNTAGATGVETYTFGVSVERPIGARLRGAAGVNYVHIRPTGVSPALLAAGGGFQTSSHSENVQLSYIATTRLGLNLTYVRDVAPSYRSDAAFELTQNIGLSANFQLSPRLSMSAGGNWRRLELPSAKASLLLGPTSDKGSSYFLGSSLQIGRQSTIGVNYAHDQRNTNLKEFDYSGDRVTVSAATRF